MCLYDPDSVVYLDYLKLTVNSAGAVGRQKRFMHLTFILKTDHTPHFLEQDEGQQGCEISLSDASTGWEKKSEYTNRQEIKMCSRGQRAHTFICMRVRPHLHRVTNALYLREQNNNGRSEERSTLVNVGVFDEDTGNEEKYILCETADIKRGRKKCVCVHGCECLPARRIMIK